MSVRYAINASEFIGPEHLCTHILKSAESLFIGMTVGVLRTDTDYRILWHDSAEKNIGAAGIASMMIDLQHVGVEIRA